MMTGSSELHHCEDQTDSLACGGAIDYCIGNEDGTLWAGNGEYESRVNYCPFCGTAAAVQQDQGDEPESYQGHRGQYF